MMPLVSQSVITDITTYLVITIVFVIFLLKNGRDKSKWGINLKRIYCPKCKTKQPYFRKPLNERQALWGGHTCRNCGTEMDKYGEVVDE